MSPRRLRLPGATRATGYSVRVPATVHKAFAKAAVRHLQDAELLQREARFANADHLAGVAAECGLKAILVEYLGGDTDARGRPTHPRSPQKSFGHLPNLWGDIASTAQGRTAASFIGLLDAENLFASWNVAERYSDGTHVDKNRADKHIVSARTVLTILQQAQIDGVLS